MLNDYTMEMTEGKVCPYCRCETKKVSSDRIYGKDYFPGKFFLQCPEIKEHYVGIRFDGKSLGSLANKELRELRKKGHSLFDPLWRGTEIKFQSRELAYRWLSNQMEIPKRKTHFGMFNDDQCMKAIKIIEEYLTTF